MSEKINICFCGAFKKRKKKIKIKKGLEIYNVRFLFKKAVIK